MNGVDVEKYVTSKPTKGNLFVKKIVAYLAVLVTMLAFIFSCIGLNSAKQSSLEKTLYTFSFPYFDQIPAIQPGIVVSLDNRGYAFTGAGITISRNVTKTDVNAFNDVQVVSFGQEVIFAGSLGQLQAFEISYDDISIDNSIWKLPTVTIGGREMDRNVEAMFRMDNNMIAIIGSGEMLPATVTINIISSTHYDVSVVFGTPTAFTTNGNEAYPHCDDLKSREHGDTIACTYEEGESIVTRTAILEGNGAAATFRYSDPLTLGIRRQYHGLAGLGPNGYVVGSCGSRYNETEQIGPIKVLYVTFDNQGKLNAGNWTYLKSSMSIGYFAMDNLYMNGAVMCYTRLASGGIICTGMDVNYNPQPGPQPSGGEIRFGSSVTVANGGASIAESKSKMQIINQSTFSLMWADDNVGGMLSYQLLTFTDNGDLVKNGPTYIVSHRSRDHTVYNHIVGMCGIDNYKSAIVEIVKNEAMSKALLHTVYVYPRPIGIAGKSFTGGNEIQFGGVYKTTKKTLQPGWMYYTNDRGDILQGFPAGYAHSQFGIFYIENREDDVLMNLENQIGMAVSDHELLLKFN